MTELNVAVSEETREFAERKARERGLATPGAFLDSVIRGVKRREAKRARLEALLRAGLESGPIAPLTPEDFEAIRERLRVRLAQRKRA